MQYNTAIVLHFLPLLHLNCLSGATRDTVKAIVLSNARSGVEALEQHRRLYSSRYQMPLMAFCCLHLCDVLIRYSPSEPNAPDVVSFCLEVLQANRAGFAICGPLQELFRKTAVECHVALPRNIRELMKPAPFYGVDDILDACTRISYTQPYEQIGRFIDPDIAEHWDDDWRQIIAPLASAPSRQVAGDGGKVMHINWLLND